MNLYHSKKITNSNIQTYCFNRFARSTIISICLRALVSIPIVPFTETLPPFSAEFADSMIESPTKPKQVML